MVKFVKKKKNYSVRDSVFLSVDRQQFWRFSFRFDIELVWFDIESVQYQNIAVEGKFMIIDIPTIDVSIKGLFLDLLLDIL